MVQKAMRVPRQSSRILPTGMHDRRVPLVKQNRPLRVDVTVE